MHALGALLLARIVVALVPFKFWRDLTGLAGGPLNAEALAAARRLAAHIDWAENRLTLSIKCLPRAMALSWLLRRRALPHSVVFATRPPSARGNGDDLHAWVEFNGIKLIGDLPGPWIETLRLGQPAIDVLANPPSIPH